MTVRMRLTPSAGIFTGDGGPTITTIADNSGAFEEFERLFMNSSGMVAFQALLDPGLVRGVYTGPDPVRDAVIAVGEQLDNLTVVNLSSRFRKY
jgi:hypothetical protein